MDSLKKLLPEWLVRLVRPYYHGWLALLADVYYGHPSDQLVVIGITGTTGKSTTAAMLSAVLNASGRACGYLTTVNFFDGHDAYINKRGLSMPGGPRLQQQLRQMLDRGCRYAIVECTSEGLAQNRHLGINFDMALFTNLSRAHLEAHGSFGNYQAAKGRLFKTIDNSHLTFDKKQIYPALPKTIGVNLDDPQSGYFLSFPVTQKFGLTFKNLQVRGLNKIFRARLLETSANIKFTLDDVQFNLNLLGEFNAFNAALAAAAANVLGVDLTAAAAALTSFTGVPGRMEKIPNNLGFTVFVDYGCEPASFSAALEAASQLPHNRLIHVFGSTGGRRDVSKQFDFGKTSAQFADEIIVTNDDVYDSDPQRIAKNIEHGIESSKLRQPHYQIILDRKQAIARALSLAQKNDIVLVTGKGSEQFLVLPGNKRISWDDREVVKTELARAPNS